MKPYSQTGLTPESRIFNYRLSRARRTVENAFGILANRFRIFRAPIPLVPEKVECIVLACCSLHNFLRNRVHAHAAYTPPGSFDSEDPESHLMIPGDWRQESTLQCWTQLAQQGSNRHSLTAKEIRDHFRDFYISNDGAVPWQWNMI